jgi:nucleoside triphosphate pyrophosphatase
MKPQEPQLSQLLHLASQSPRRRMMMGWLGIPIATTQADIDETPLPGEIPAHLATRLAREKAQAVVALQPNTMVLTADTVVDFDGEALGKPATTAEARETLRRLREGLHRVHTGVALTRAGGRSGRPHGAESCRSDDAGPSGHTHVRCVTTEVTMRPYTDAEIEAYIATGDPMDKAGAYAIQHPEFHPVEQLHVCYANVVGLPLCAVVRLLHRAGWTFSIDVPALCYLHFGYRCPGPDAGVEV